MNTATHTKPTSKKRAKTGGRKKGSPNKITRDTRELLKEILAGELEIINETLKEAEPKDRLQFIIKLLPYTIPQYANIENLPEDQPTKPKNTFLEIMKNKSYTIANNNKS